MTEMIERVAKALSISDGNHPDACSNDEDEIPSWTLYVDDARAAIEAMRIPTSDMNEAGRERNYGRYATEAWTAMIDQALAELGPQRDAGTADEHGVPRAEE